ADVAECHGQCYRILGRPKAATSKLLEARRLQTPDRARTRTYAETGLALSYLHGGDLDAALEAGSRALDLAKGVTSTRTSELFGELDATFATYDRSAGARQWRAAASAAAVLPVGGGHREGLRSR
nr:hypothetical protein [Micromonospora sp. DSM 115978]